MLNWIVLSLLTQDLIPITCDLTGTKIFFANLFSVQPLNKLYLPTMQHSYSLLGLHKHSPRVNECQWRNSITYLYFHVMYHFGRMPLNYYV